MRALKLISVDRIQVPAPIIEKDGTVIWGWSLSLTERRADRHACVRSKPVNNVFYDAVLEARNERTNAKKRT
jgi:hypothetical protein